ncbi:insulin-induced protein-domain-containing protein [Obelidium mucronatum]|nr:insulin-induced protein-domain-containing protein [Obelidium mucronatum]
MSSRIAKVPPPPAPLKPLKKPRTRQGTWLTRLRNTCILFSLGFVLSVLTDSLQQTRGLSHHSPQSSATATTAPHLAAAAAAGYPQKSSSPSMDAAASSYKETPWMNKHRGLQHGRRNTNSSFADAPPLWIGFCFGISGVLIGWLYPKLDMIHLKKSAENTTASGTTTREPTTPSKTVKQDQSSLLRLIGGVMGVNYAVSKLEWGTHVQANCVILVLSVGLWVMFDGTRRGFFVSWGFSLAGTLVGVWLCKVGVYEFLEPDFVGVRLWFPCVLFLASVCFGCVGRGLVADEEDC